MIVDNLNKYNVIENNQEIKNDVAEEKIALIKQENLGNVEKPKSYTLWEKFKKLCCICKIIELWKKLFSSPKTVKPTKKLNNIQVLEPQIYEVKEKVEKVVEIAPKVEKKEKQPDIIVQIPQVIPPVIPQNNENIVNIPPKIQEIKLPKKPKIIESIFEKVIPKNPLPKPKKRDERIGQKLDNIHAMPQLNHEDKDFHLDEIVVVLRSGPPQYFQYGRIDQILDNNNYRIDVKSDKGCITKGAVAIYKINPMINRPNEPLIELADEELDLAEPGPRTIGMNRFLKNFVAYDKNKNIIKLNHKEYVPLTAAVQDISKKAVASCGSSVNREIIVLDPDNSPILNKHYEELKNILIKFRKNLGRSLSEEEVLKQVRDYVRHHIFPSRNDPNLSKKVDKFIELKRRSKQTPKTDYEISPTHMAEVPIIPIDEFIKEGLGICRHHAIVTAYLLDRLTKESKETRMLEGVVQHMRDNVPADNGKLWGHIWVTFLSTKEKKRWHIDTLWREVIDFSSPKNIEYLKLRGYGENAINNQINKARIVPI